MTNISQNMLDVLVPFTRGHRELTASAVMRERGMAQKTVARILSRYEKSDLIEYKRDGRNKRYYFPAHPVSFMMLNLVEQYKAVQFFARHKKLQPMITELSRCGSIVLFGSYAKGKEKQDSDVDIWYVGSKTTKVTKIAARYHVYMQYDTLSSFQHKLKKKHPLSIEIVKDHIIFGEVHDITTVFQIDT
jgi:predicted nucleotidyltransferase/predicted transcriptional regulator